jgi:serine-type D-Ala-D-Ala carboxypeptidase/endopeptidase (penicillin-binding protein 4)
MTHWFSLARRLGMMRVRGALPGFLGVAAVGALASVRPDTEPVPAGVPNAVSAPASDRSEALVALDADIGTILNASVRGGRWGALVISLSRGDTLFTRNAGALMQPASTLKLFTSGLAFDRFGPDYQLATEALRDGSIDGTGTLDGNLYLRGGGDPSLSTRFLGEEASPMDNLARAIAATGLTHVRGDLVADASAFDDQRIPEGWKKQYLSAAYAAPVSALSLNENVMWVVVAPGKGQAEISLEPRTTAFSVANNVTLRSGSRGSAISVRRKTDGSLDVRGWIGTNASTEKYSMVVNDPPCFAAGALRASLASMGVKVDGAIREGTTPSAAVSVASVVSPPLSQIVSEMNRESINHVAELLFRDAARVSSPNHVGTVQAGEDALHEFISAKIGAPATDVRVSDGSGLSTHDSVTARAMVSLLAYANGAPWSSAFHASLPVAGESELLRKRMKRTPAQGNLHAKTGTTASVVSLAGYVTAHDGELLAFALIYNGGDLGNARFALDRVGATLAGFNR